MIAGPAAIGLICPWADLAIDVEGKHPVARDPLILPSMCAERAPRYAGDHDPRLPGVSPVYGDMAGLPPIHRRFENLWHVFHLQAGVLAEADEAIADLGAKLRTHTTEGKVATT